MRNAEKIYEHAGLGNRIGFGRKPALLIIDLQVGFTDPEKSPLAGDLGTPIEATNRLIDSARANQVPILFTVIAYEDENFRDGGWWIVKAPTLKLLRRGSGLDDLDRRLNALPTDMIVIKKYASAFFGTCLSSTLGFLGVDTIIVAGCTTSGCVRATVVDGLQYGFRVIVASEAAGDRALEPHQASLFDMDSKYSDVLSVDEVLDYFRKLE
jgi:maleamate amidohydrolase